MHAPRPRPPSPASQALSGIRTALPLMIAMVPIGTVYGAVAVAKGLSVTEALLMSGLVFAGGAQFVAMDMWTHPASAAALGLAALLVNLRHVLMGASMAGKLGRFKPLQRLAAMPFLTDEAWALAERRARDGGRDPAASLTPAWYFGAALSIYATWLAATATGALLGAAIGDPAALGLDFAFPAVFIVLVSGFCKGRGAGAVVLASAAAALLVHWLLPGVWFILAGALAGLAAAALATDEAEGDTVSASIAAGDRA
ncbi:AzlC family ABC transporter permease [Rhizobium sp. SG2393]|uniref:AzlC family ABC transporter permease n=1 Tax=Rhizobium sp. SG2393 TaxID=3276279 RepID=UPI0036715724